MHLIHALVVLITFLPLAAAGTGQSSPRLDVHPLDDADLASPQPWAFLASTLDKVDVVSLPEPIHMTHEFPLVRLGLIKFLNEHLGFHVVAMEGSLVDAWATQDRLIASNRSDQDLADAQLSLFPLWNTPEIQELFRYEVATWSTATPLYVTAYDVQPGTGKGTYGPAAFRLLAERLATYSQPPPGFVLDAWVSALEPLTGACTGFAASKQPAVVRAIEQLQSWIVAASPGITARFHRLPAHAAALRLVPANLRGSLALCADVTANPSARYKASRDREGAVFAEHLRGVSPEAKLVLWAHWSHLTYVDAATGVSVGQQLRQKLGTRIYTILPVAERGTAIVIFPNRDSDDDIGFGWVQPRSDPFSTRMQAISPMSFFLDLQDPALRDDGALAGDQAIPIESRIVHLRLSQATDAIVWLKRVSPPRLRLPLLLVMGGMHYRARLVVFGLFAVIGVLTAVLLRRRRRRSPATR